MTLVNLRVLLREFELRNMPIGRITVEAVDANGPHFDIDGQDVIFSELGEALIVDGVANRVLEFEPTDGTYALRWRFFDADDNVLLTRHVEIPDVPEVDFGALELINVDTLQPSPDVRAAWEATAALATGSAAAAAGSASAAGASASNAAGSALSAGQSAQTATQGAATATGAASTATSASGAAVQAAADAETSRALAAGRATSASNSADAAAGSASAAAGSATAAAGSATQAGNSATAASGSATAAAGSATTAGNSAAASGQSADRAEQAAQAGGFVYSAPANASGVLDLSAMNRNTIAHRTLIGNITGITLPTTPYIGQIVTLVLTQDATGGRALAMPAAVLGNEGMDPTLSTQPGSIDILSLMYDGVRWWSFVQAQRGL